MTTKVKVAIVAVSVLTAYAFGRYSAPEKIKTVTQTVTVVKEVEKIHKDTSDHKTTTITKKPDGTTTTVITDDSNTSEHSTSASNTNSDTKSEKEITYSSSKVTVSALAGLKPFSSTPDIVYGASVSRPILGPITVGVWGLTNATFGASVGLTF